MQVFVENKCFFFFGWPLSLSLESEPICQLAAHKLHVYSRCCYLHELLNYTDIRDTEAVVSQELGAIEAGTHPAQPTHEI